MRAHHVISATILCLLASAGSTQALVPAPQAPPAQVLAPIAAPDQAILRTGTEVPLRMSEQLTTKNKQVRVGQRFRMETAEAVSVNGQVVIPVGSPAMGEITDVRNKGMWGKSGHIGARVLYVLVGGRQIRLSGTFDDKGVTGTAMVVTSVALLPLAGFFTTGTSAKIDSGAYVKAFVDEDVPLAFQAAAPAPLTVAVSQPVTVAATPTSPAGSPASPSAPIPVR